MTDECFAFVEDVKERSIVKRSASCKKNGSSTSKSFKRELTNKEIEARHGPCKVYNLGCFMSFDEFKSMPKDIQVRYINMLQDKYDVGVLTINREVFGFQDDDNRLKTYLRTQGILKDTYPGTKRKKSGLDQLRNDILLQKKGINMEEKLVRDIPKFMDYNGFKALEKSDEEMFINRLLKDYQITVGAINKILFENGSINTLSQYCRDNKLNIQRVLPYKATPKKEDLERFEKDVNTWKSSFKLADEEQIAEPTVQASVEEPEVDPVPLVDVPLVNVFNTLSQYCGDPKLNIQEEDSKTKEIEKPNEEVHRNTMVFSSEYIADEINLNDIVMLKTLFQGKKVRVRINVEEV